MGFIANIYKRNIYGVIGTLIFHILLVSAFLLAEIDMKGNVKEEEIIIEFPDLPAEPEIQEELENTEEQISSGEDNAYQTNVASNRLSSESTTKSAEEFLDDEFLKEVEAAKQLANDVNNQLSKEKINMDDIKMPVETTEGMNPDSIKNVVYVGESNIVYFLENRYHVSLPKPIYLAQGGGKVIVDISVDRTGKVVNASVRKNPNLSDPNILEYAQIAAIRTIFNADGLAPEIQKGTIHYTFIAQ